MGTLKKLFILLILTLLSLYVFAASPAPASGANSNAASPNASSAAQRNTSAQTRSSGGGVEAAIRENRGSDEIAGALDFIVAKIDDEIITMSDIRDKFIVYKAMQARLNKPEPQFSFEIKKMLLMKSVEQMLYLKYAKTHSLEVSEAQVSSRVYKIKTAYRIETDDELVVNAGRSGSMGRVENVNELRDKIKEMMLMDRARQHLVSNVFRKKIANPTEAELRRFYTENPSFFYAPEAVKIQQLVIRVKEDADFDALEKVEKLLKEIAKKAKAGENFSKLIAKYAEISYRSNNGFVSASFLKREELKSLFPKYVKYAFKLNAGEISPVIIDGQKRIIIKIAEKKSKQLRPFDEVKKLVKQYIFSEKGMKLLTEWVSEQYRKGNIKIYYDRLRIAR